MKKSHAISTMVTCLFSLSTHAWADTQGYFKQVDAANAAIEQAEGIRAPYAARKLQLSADADRIANSAPLDCGALASQQSRSSESCEPFRQKQKLNFEDRARNNVILDRADALLEQANQARLEAENKLAHAGISASNAESPELRHLKGLQGRLVAEEKALKDFDEQMNSKGTLARAFARFKDKALDGDRKAIARRIEQARYNYLAALRAFKDIRLESGEEQLAVRLPEVSEKVLHAQDKSDCVTVADADSTSDRAMAEVKALARDFVDDVTVRSHHSDDSRCGRKVATASRVDRRPGFLESASPAPVEDRTGGIATAAAAR